MLMRAYSDNFDCPDQLIASDKVEGAPRNPNCTNSQRYKVHTD